MAWISVYQQLRDHRKTRKLANNLNIPKPLAVGYLIFIWLWAVDNVDSEGTIIEASEKDIEEAALWNGQPGHLYKELVNCKWIDAYEDRKVLHNWGEFNRPFYQYQKRKEYDKKRKRAGNSTGSSMETPPETLPEIHESSSTPPPTTPPIYPRRGKKDKKEGTDIRLRPLIEWYESEYKRVHKITPSISWARDMKLMKSMLSAIGKDKQNDIEAIKEMKKLISFFMVYQDKFINETGRSLAIMNTCLNKLRQSFRKKELSGPEILQEYSKQLDEAYEDNPFDRDIGRIFS